MATKKQLIEEILTSFRQEQEATLNDIRKSLNENYTKAGIIEHYDGVLTKTL